jgi:histidyl-tRNA synthetase
VKYRSIKGTKDILPGEVQSWQHLERTIHAVMNTYQYREIRTPAFETTALFSRSIGELTDIVSKEMYTFADRSQESLTLRPEGTAAVLRSYLQHNLGEASPLSKLYYVGPMFRQERPQAGRLRQFHQYGAEAIGSQEALADAEIVHLSLQILRAAGLTDHSLTINSVGCEKCRPPYRAALTRYLAGRVGSLSDESRARLELNPLRILDSKDERDRQATADAPLMKDHLCPECMAHFDQLQDALRDTKTPFAIDGRLVRGLDYYTKTAFEITSRSLGAQDALAGGGRYDLLTEQLGGKRTPAVGFAAGIERLLIALEKQHALPSTQQRPQLYVVALGEAARRWAFRKTHELRNNGFSIEMDYLGRSVKAQMRDANRSGAPFVLVVGDKELATGTFPLKVMADGQEIPVTESQIEAQLKA